MKNSVLTRLAFAALTLSPALIASSQAQNTPIRPGYCFNRSGCYGVMIGFLYYNDCLRQGGQSWKNWDTRQCVNFRTIRQTEVLPKK